MKRVRRDRERWQPPSELLPNVVFQCRRCRSVLTASLALLIDAASLSRKPGTSLVPTGHYWRVTAGGDFAGQFALALADLFGVGYHPESRRLLGCCGPGGAWGPNRVCGSGHEVGTERSDCVWPNAVYFDPSRVVAVAPDAYTRWVKG